MIGSTFARRFELVAKVGEGGAGSIYRARDLSTGALVALKLLHAMDVEDRKRFERETEALRALDHPAIVRYVAHGEDETGCPFLAMEWFEGTDLQKRLAQGPISTEDALIVARRLAGALAAIHERGVLHRDIKPANVFLPDGAVSAIKLVDFGLARRRGAQAITAEGFAIGTPGFMPPEQMRGESVDARADIFALGALLYQCLTGRAAFRGKNVVETMMCALLEEPPPVAKLAPNVPPQLADLITRMMAKARAGRPHDGLAVSAELADLDEADRKRRRVGPSIPGTSLATPESTLGAMLAADWSRTDVAPLTSRPSPFEASEDGSFVARTLHVLEHYGASVELALSHALIATFPQRASLEEQALIAARCALSLAELGPGVSVSVAMARRAADGLGDTIEAVARPLSATDSVRVDDLTASLLPTRFQRAKALDGLGHVLAAERDELDAPRLVRGKATLFVGRSRELAEVALCTERAVLECESSALVVSGEAGVGKSRLRQEALRALAIAFPRLAVWSGRADPSEAGAPLAMLKALLRKVLGITGLNQFADRAGISLAVLDCVGPADAERVTRFLGEMVGAPFDDGDVELQAARRDRVLMGDQMRRAFVDLVDAACRNGPLLIILEDAHFGDVASITFVVSALRLLPRRPLSLWVIGRPALLPRVDQELQALSPRRIHLRELTHDAALQLARGALGPSASDVDVEAIVKRSGLNPLLLEEVVRAHLDSGGRASRGSTSLQGLLEVRITELGPELRRVLCAASVAGEVFWEGLAQAILPDMTADTLGAALTKLTQREWLIARPTSKYPRERELAFRHASLCEAALAMLSAADCKAGHAAVARWLERSGEPDASVIAAHLSRAGRATSAAEHFARAAHQALIVDDHATALGHARAGLECQPPDLLRGRLEVLLAQAHRWAGEIELTLSHSLAAMMALAPTAGAPSEPWFEGAGEAVMAASRLRKLDVMVEVSEALRKTTGGLEATPAQIIAISRAAMLLAHANVGVRAEPLYAFLDRVEAGVANEPLLRARIAFSRAWREQMNGNWHGYRLALEEAVVGFDAAGDVRAGAQARANCGHACLELGVYSEAVAIMQKALDTTGVTATPGLRAVALNNLGMALAYNGELDAGVAREREAVEAYVALKDKRLEGASRIYLATILEMRGELAEAEIEAQKAVTGLETIPPILPRALAKLADIVLARGRAEEAFALAKRAVAAADLVGAVDGDAPSVHLTLAECLRALGKDDSARTALSRARTGLDALASKIPDVNARRTFIEAIPAHARIGALELELKRP